MWRLVSLDGSSLDVAETTENGESFGYPGASRGESAFPQLRFVALVENGTHVLFGARLGSNMEVDATQPNGVTARHWQAGFPAADQERAQQQHGTLGAADRVGADQPASALDH